MAEKGLGVDARGFGLTLPRLRALAPLLALAVWTLLEIGVALARPGELLELSLIGIAGAVAWPLVVGRTTRAAGLALGATAFAAPLLPTWPAQTYTAHLGFSSPLLLAIVAPSSLLVLATAALVLRERAALRRPPLLACSAAVLLLVGGALASVAATHPQAALADWWLVFAMPIAFGALVAARVRTGDGGWRLLLTALAAALVPAVVGVAAYVLEFGVPRSGDDLVLNKQILFRPFLFQQLTFGNVGHFADFALLLLPAAVLATAARRMPRLARVAAGVLALALTCVVLFAMSRAALVLAGGALAASLAILALCRRPASALVAALGLALVLGTFTSSAARNSVAVLAPGAKPTRVLVKPRGGGPPVPVGPSTGAGGETVPGTKIHVTESSEVVRLSAVREGLHVFTHHHTPLGVGSGQYPLYDPVHTAPHSLALLVLAEDGAVGAAGLGLLLLFLVVEGLRALRGLRRDLDSAELLRLACLGGALLYLVHGLGAGSPLTLGNANVWTMLFWLQVGLVAGLRTSRAEDADAA